MRTVSLVQWTERSVGVCRLLSRHLQHLLVSIPYSHSLSLTAARLSTQRLLSAFPLCLAISLIAYGLTAIRTPRSSMISSLPPGMANALTSRYSLSTFSP